MTIELDHSIVSARRRDASARQLAQLLGVPGGPVDHQVNTDWGGRMLYWNEPEGHQWEILTVSYARRLA